MIEIEGGVNQHPENGNVFQADPAILVRDNPAALIFNREAYARMAGRFSYGTNGQFESPQVVQVITYSAEHEVVLKTFVLDGMTRTKFVYDHINNPAVIPPDFIFTVKDVTTSVLQNPAYIPDEERVNGQQALTMLQYLRAVIPPTIAHAEIAPDRIAAHIINAWENRVGSELAQRFSALAALNFLADLQVPTATDNLLVDYLGRQDELVAGEITPEGIQERANLQLALREFATIIRQTKIRKTEVARSAYILVSTASPVIGGEREARKQVYGLLHSPSVDAKLTSAFPDHLQREEMRIQLGRDIIEAFARLSQSPDRERFNNDIGSALANPHLSFTQLTEIIRAANPSRTYDQVRQTNNRDRLQKYYQTVERRQELSEIETHFVDRFGRVPVMPDADLSRITSQIQSIVSSLQRAESLRNQLVNNRDGMLRRGIRPDTIDEAILAINSSREQLVEAATVPSAQGKKREMDAAVDEIQRKMTRQSAIYEAGKIVDEVYSESLRSAAGSRLRRDICFYILREFDITDQTAIRNRLSQLKSLDDDLQSQVIAGDIRINSAIQIHKGRRKKPVQPTRVQEEPTSITPPAPEVVEAQPEIGTPAAEVQTIEDQITINRQKAEMRRKAVNDEKFRQGSQDYLLDTLMQLDLDADEVTSETKIVVDNMFRAAGRIRFNHPDIVRLVEDSPRKDEEILRLREIIVNFQQEIAARDTRTGR